MFFLISLAFFSITEVYAASDSGSLLVFVSIVPQTYILERIGAPYVKVEALVPASQDPHTFTVTPQKMLDLTRARAYFTIGMPFEERLREKLSGANQQLVFYDMAEGVYEADHSHDHDHDHDREHSCSEDPHIWLAPPLLVKISQNSLSALCEMDPMHRDIYQANARRLLEDIEQCHQEISQQLALHKGKAFYIYHPDLGWFAETYGLRQETIQASGKPPSAKYLVGVIQKAQKDKARVIFVQPQFETSTAEKVAQAVGAKLISFNPMEKDILLNLRHFAKSLTEYLSP
ncbi:MAG TPA: zinc ABC transporter substrate-binding protein [Candidatus Hydrogenedentes bacterium]|nr:zinc ABC transporter substrate-binding protein [Candidatus Hydrogenedentota bacterium]HOL75491.1 zinc ABC transporter substrate-binding protein [Candidatus Hydrogenedentota bacterium]HPO86067.1 zinc ABC transporter substrate-binding protein [Candidatus Hydrogenedentota bacterium]